MYSLKADFDELRERIRHGRELSHASFEPIYYLVFPPKQILEVKRQTPAWVSRLKQDGWNVKIFSMAEEIDQIFKADGRRQLWLAGDRQAPLDWSRTNSSLANALTHNDHLLERLKRSLRSMEGERKGLLLVTDLEALHPYIRIGAIEGQLQGEFNVATVFLYPGLRTGKTRLKFLGFYVDDGNYRSVHVGG
jgi:hypothetical protein